MAESFPRKYGRYRLLGVLGKGGMGVVYRAETEPLAGITRTVAIKRMQAGTGATEEEMIEMLLDEARIWVRLQHPNIVSVVDFGRELHDWYLALELIDGVTAQDLVDADGKLPVPEALCIVERVARALAYAHALPAEDGRRLRIVHRDVKPANILLSARGEVKLTDFGIARATDRRAATQAGQVRGSLRVMSPEQVLGQPVDARSDLFSLGCTLHELVTGRPLLAGSRQEVLALLSEKRIPSPEAGMPPAVRELVVRLTAAEPARRPASAEEVARQARAMLLPEAVEDVEHALAARVRRVRSEDEPVAPSPESGTSNATVESPGSEDTTEPRAAEPTVPSPRESAEPTVPLPPGARPARPWERPPPSRAAPLPAPAAAPRHWTYHARIAGVIAAGLLAAWGGVRWLTCSKAVSALATARVGAGSIVEMGNAASACSAYCRSTPDRRIATATGLFFGGRTAAEAALGLRSSPEERRFAATLRVASRGWAASSAREEALALPPSPESACLASVLAFDTGSASSVEVPDGAAGSACAQILTLSETLRLDDMDAALALLGKAGDSRAASLAAAVYLAQTGTVAGVGAKIDKALRAGEDDPTGVWIPASWTRIAGERGRLTTPLDDTAAIGAILAGDVRARAGDFTEAMAHYRKAEARGWKHPDLLARQIDLFLHAARLDGRGVFVRDPATLGATAARLAVTADARLGSTDSLAARVALAHLAGGDAASAEKALGSVHEPALAGTIANEILRVRRLEKR